MNIGDLYSMSNEQFKLSDLKVVDEYYYNNIDKSTWGEYSQLSYLQWCNLLKENGFNTDKIVQSINSKNIFRTLFYSGDFATVGLETLDPSWLLIDFNKQRYLQGIIEMKKLFIEGNYAIYFLPENNLFAIDYFNKLYKEINIKEVYDVFIDLYTISNFGFHIFSKDTLNYVLKNQDKEKSKERISKINSIDNEGFVTVYRGMGKYSTDIAESLSWTLSEKVANKFANFYEKGEVYKAKVNINNIIDYLTDRNEEEVLVKYSNLKNITKIY